MNCDTPAEDDEDNFPRENFCDVRFDRIPKGAKKPPGKVFVRSIPRLLFGGGGEDLLASPFLLYLHFLAYFIRACFAP